MRFSIRQLITGLTCNAVVLAAFQYGFYYVGTMWGIGFALMAALVVYVFVRAYATNGRFRRVKIGIATVLALVVLVGFPILAPFTDLAFFIRDRSDERLTNSQVHSVLKSDPRFSQLEFEYDRPIGRRGMPKTRITGVLKSEEDFRELRARILRECVQVRSRWLLWDVRILESKKVHSDYDNAIFGEPESEPGH